MAQKFEKPGRGGQKPDLDAMNGAQRSKPLPKASWPKRKKSPGGKRKSQRRHSEDIDVSYD